MRMNGRPCHANPNGLYTQPGEQIAIRHGHPSKLDHIQFNTNKSLETIDRLNRLRNYVYSHGIE